MRHWKKGLVIGLFSSMLLEQQTVAAAVGLNRPDINGYKLHAIARPSKVVAQVVLPTGPLDPPLEPFRHVQRAKLQQQQLLVLASRGDLPRPVVQKQPERQTVKQAAQSNAAPTLMKQSGVSAMLGSRVVTLALRYQGVPYQYGGTSPSGFDCSGFIQYVMSEAGVEVPRTTYQQINAGVQVGRANLQPGDLVFFACGGSPTSHAGLYIGNGKFIHADPKRGIFIDDLNGDYWASVYQTAVRVQ